MRTEKPSPIKSGITRFIMHNTFHAAAGFARPLLAMILFKLFVPDIFRKHLSRYRRFQHSGLPGISVRVDSNVLPCRLQELPCRPLPDFPRPHQDVLPRKREELSNHGSSPIAGGRDDEAEADTFRPDA
jgi:hypothetical protein